MLSPILAASVAVLAAGSSLSSHIRAPRASCRVPSVAEGRVHGCLQPVFLLRSGGPVLGGDTCAAAVAGSALSLPLRPCRCRQGEPGDVPQAFLSWRAHGPDRLPVALQPPPLTVSCSAVVWL